MSALSDNYFTRLCKCGSAEQVRRALADGANVHAKGRFLGYSAVVYAARWNPDPEVLRVLLDAGASVNTLWDDGATVLMGAVWNTTNVEVIKTLLAAGADIHARDQRGRPVLHYAAGNDKAEVFAFLRELGLKIEERDRDAMLCEAANFGASETVRVLLDAGANANAERDGHSALFGAAGNTDAEVFQMLAAAGGTIDPADLNEALCEAAESGAPETIRALLVAGAQVDARAKTGETALMLAAWRNQSPVVQALLDAGADTRLTDPENDVALDYAYLGGNRCVIALLKAQERE